jgi:Flp pilus assembly protein TadG
MRKNDAESPTEKPLAPTAVRPCRGPRQGRRVWHTPDPTSGPVACRRLRPLAKRTGAAVVETAVALSLFVTLLLGTVDLGYGIFRYHVLAQSTRKIARHATVRGSLADQLGSWGPDRIATSADSNEDISQTIASSLVGWELPGVDIQVDWIDGGNEAEKGHRVRVHLSAPYQPMMTFILGSPVITLTSTSVMRIAH